MKEMVIGIDLGTTHSLVAYCDEAGPHVIRDENGDARLPSVLRFEESGDVIVGWQAKTHAVELPRSTVYSVKRLMGRGYDELVAGGELEHLPYPVVKRPTDAASQDIAAVQIGDTTFTPPEISAMVLRELKDRASRHFGREIHKAVITVPAYFDDAQRQATRDAGQIAGLEVIRIINEPTAAALAYGLGIREQLESSEPEDIAASAPTAPPSAIGPSLTLAGSCASSIQMNHTDSSSTNDEESLVAVYDLGGGTFDVSILRLASGVFEVLSTHGNTRLGGDDFDREIMSLVYRDIAREFKINIESPATQQAIRSLAENVKIRLTTEDAASIEIDLGIGRIYRRTITRAEFEQMIAPWVEKTLASCRQALRDGKVSAGQIDQVVMVGGCTRIPYVRRSVEHLFKRVPYTALNPDEVVALGAAVQAGILGGLQKDALLLDVVPLSLGIETMGGAMGKLILRNTRIPCQATERFSTFVDGQTNVKINVLQGERELAEDCRSLGEFELRGLPPMPAGIPKILVTFLIDENGILNVSAVEERSHQEASIQIVPKHGLTPEEVRQMELASYEHAREDMTAHRLIDLRNQITFDTGKTEQMLLKVADKIEPVYRKDIETAMRELRELGRSSCDPDAIHQSLNAFDRKTVRLAEMAILYSLRVQPSENSTAEA